MNKRVFEIFRISMSFTLVIALVFGSFFNVRKAEAIAPAIPAGLGLAALAAELGISVEALTAGIGALLIAGTGVYVMNDADLWAPGDASTIGDDYNWNSKWQDGSLDLPGWDTWGDLDPEQQESYGTPRNYLQWQWNWLALQTGLLDYNNGNLEPSEEPDPENDPGGNSSWHRLRNVLTCLAVGGTAVALNTGVNALADSLANGIKGLLFGTDENTSFMLGGDIGLEVNGVHIPFTYISPPDSAYADWYVTYMQSNQNNTLTYINPTSAQLRLGSNGDAYVLKITGPCLSWYAKTGKIILEYTASNQTYSLALTPGNGYAWLNPYYSGTYDFGNGTTIANGVYTGNAAPDYGQVADTPYQIPQSIFNGDNYNTVINNYTNTGNDGEQRAITVPSWYLNGTDNPAGQYEDFVDVVPDTDITQIPDDGPLPDPNPNPNPGGNTEFQQDYGQRVMQLLAQPFDQLFPFCLIGDLQDLLTLFHDAAYSEPMRGASVVNGTESFVIPLSEFNVEGVEDFEIDLSEVKELGNMVRPFFTGLFIIGLLVGTFRFFLTRGGE